MSEPADRLAERKATITEARQASLSEDIRAVMRTAEGRRVVWWILGEAGHTSVSYVPGDPHATTFREGMRNVAVLLDARLGQVDADMVLLMQREAVQARRAERAERAAAAMDAKPE